MTSVRSLASLTPHPSPTASTPCITIDKGIPLPTATGKGRHTHGAAQILRALEIGDSFIYPASTGKLPTINNAARHGGNIAKKLSRKFTCRTVTENGVKVVRVWRVA